MQLVALTALLPAVALAVAPAVDAGAPQSPPTYSGSAAEPTTSSPYMTSSPYPQSSPYMTSSPYPLSSSPGPVSNITSGYPTSGGGGYPTTYPVGNLSTTTKAPSTSVVVATVTGAGGQASTQTSVVVVTPSGNSGPAPQSSTSPKAGAGARMQAGGAAALAVFLGGMAFML